MILGLLSEADEAGDAQPEVAGFAFGELVAFAVGDDLDHHVGGLAHHPDEVGVVLLVVRRVGVDGDIEAQEHVGDERRELRCREDTDVGRREPAARLAVRRAWASPGGVERLGQEPHDLLGVDVVRGLVVLDDDLRDVRLDDG